MPPIDISTMFQAMAPARLAVQCTCGVSMNAIATTAKIAPPMSCTTVASNGGTSLSEKLRARAEEFVKLVLAVVRKELKKRQDAAEGFERGNRPENSA